MQRSESIDKLADALSKAQGEMEPALKDKTGFFKNKYADLAGVIESIRQPFAKNGLSFTQLPRFDGKTVNVLTMILHSSGQFISEEMCMSPTKADPQGVASAVTYAKRYALQAMCGVPSEDDDGNAASGKDAKHVDDIPHNLDPKILAHWRDIYAEIAIDENGTPGDLSKAWSETPKDYRYALVADKDKAKLAIETRIKKGVGV